MKDKIKKQVEDCGCEFTTISDDIGSSTFLSKCRCQKHYDEQFIAKYSDHEGYHIEEYEPINPLPFEKARHVNNIVRVKRRQELAEQYSNMGWDLASASQMACDDENKEEGEQQTKCIKYMVSMGYKQEIRDGEIYFTSGDADYDYESALDYYKMQPKEEKEGDSQ